jgi:hypothetical protein
VEKNGKACLAVGEEEHGKTAFKYIFETSFLYHKEFELTFGLYGYNYNYILFINYLHIAISSEPPIWL